MQPKKCEKFTKNFYFGSSRSPMLINLKSPSPVLVMTRSIFVTAFTLDEPIYY